MDSFYSIDYQLSPKDSRFGSQDSVWSGKNQAFRPPVSSETDSSPSIYNRHWLFEMVSKGTAKELDGFEEHLMRNKKYLTDWEYKDPETGKTALLKALLNLNNKKNDTVSRLLEIAEKGNNLKEFINAAYTDSYYRGQTALHVAIERRSAHFVELLVRNGADVHARASGIFFKQKKSGDGFYFGELPLSLAACTNQLDIVTFLLENPHSRADVSAVDSRGNNVLHALVAVADNTPENTKFVTKMYNGLLMKSVKIRPLENLEATTNKKGLTPLKLAAKTGKLQLFKDIMGREVQEEECRHLSRKFTEWAYGPVHSSLYDLSSLDTDDEQSVLEIIVHGTKNEFRHEMLLVEPLNKLLQEKWNKFARFIFCVDFFIYFAYMTVFTLVGYNRKENMTLPFPIEHTTEGYLRLTGQIITLLGAFYLFFTGVRRVWFLTPTLPPPPPTPLLCGSSFVQSLMLLASALLYTTGRNEYVGFMVIAMALGWINTLYYSRGFYRMGVYSVMVQKILVTDILRFLIVYIVFLFGFGVALVTLIEEGPPKGRMATSQKNYRLLSKTECVCDSGYNTYKDLYSTFLELFRFTIGMGDLEFTEDYKFKEVFILLLISYVILTYILLLNLLIALMSQTVEKISKDSKNIWKLQRAVTILDLERSLPRCLRDRLRSGESVVVGMTPDNKEDMRRCYRIDEVNWTKWNTNLGLINEDPGNSNVIRRSSLARNSRFRRGKRGNQPEGRGVQPDVSASLNSRSGLTIQCSAVGAQHCQRCRPSDEVQYPRLFLGTPFAHETHSHYP
uniref:Transient receptor potential cation channel subfamily V member 1 n=1 Tax=Callorhinchus milii TaxID=7868 RepID=A0A4W3J0F3_CALMI